MYRVTPYRNVKSRDVFDLFDDFFSETRKPVGSFRIDVQDLEKEYKVEADVPGLSKENIEIHFENEQLIISITKENEEQEETDNYIHRERFFGNYKRSIYLKDVDPKQFKAKLENGVLTITAQKAEDKISKFMIDID